MPCVPFDNELVAILTGVTVTVMLSALVAVCAVSVVESVTFIVKPKEPEAVGVPEITPAVDNVRPPGRDPEARLQEYGEVPPLASKGVE